MKKKARLRYIAFQFSNGKWGVLDRTSGELVKQAGQREEYPQTWARTRADRLNKELEKAGCINS